MKTYKLILSLTFFLLIFYSCKKNDDPVDEKSMADLIVPENFNWSVQDYYGLSINIIGNGNGKTLQLLDLDGNNIDSKRIFDNQVNFNFRLPSIFDSVRIYSPSTFISKYLPINEGIVNFNIGEGFKSTTSKESDYALNFNGENNYVELDNNGAGGIVIEYPFTFSAWLKTSGPGVEGGDMVLVNIADPTVDDLFYGIYLRKRGGDKYKPNIRAKNANKDKKKEYNQDLADDTWHQVVGVFSADGKRKLYVDGVYRKSDNSVVNFGTGAVITSIGRWGNSSPDSYFNGLLDNICIWNKELSDSEIADYYLTSPPVSDANLVGNYKFNEGSGTQALNSSTAGGYSGNITGATYVLISGSTDTDGDGVPDDEDYWPEDPTKAYLAIYPSGSNFYFHCYEDLWPALGDYDFNDVVLKTKLHTWKNGQNQLVGGRVKTSVYWIGGGIPRGAGVEWFKSNESASQLTYLPDETVTFTEPTNVISDPLVFNAVQLFDDNIIESLNDSVDFEYSWDHEIAGNNLWVQVYIYSNLRSHEVHMIGQPPTKAADMDLFGTEDDASQNTWAWNPGDQFSNPANFYKTSTNLPWGLVIITPEFQVPNEKIEIINAYPQFQAWAESGGTVSQDWYNNPDESKVFIPGEE
jgi:LruC domain-containing protein